MTALITDDKETKEPLQQTPRRWQEHGNTAQLISAAAAVLTLLVAIAGFSIAYRQISAIRENTREAAARSMYGEFLKYGLEKDKVRFICPADQGREFVERRAAEKDQDGRTTAFTEEFQIYGGFVRYMLNAYELILDAVAENDEGWIESIKSDLNCHKAYLETADFLCFGFKTYDEKLRNLILDAIGGNRRRDQICK